MIEPATQMHVYMSVSSPRSLGVAACSLEEYVFKKYECVFVD